MSHDYIFIQSTQLCTQSIMNTTVMSCNLKNSSDCYSSTNVTTNTDSNGDINVISCINLSLQEKFYTCVFLYYECGQAFHTIPVNTSEDYIGAMLLHKLSVIQVVMIFKS